MNQREIQFIHASDHGNIVKFLWASVVEDELWIAMEFLEGGTLTDSLKVNNFSEGAIA